MKINANVAKLPPAFMLALRVMNRDTNSRIDALDRKVDAKFANHEKRFEAIEDKLDSLSADVSAILAIVAGKHGPPKA